MGSLSGSTTVLAGTEVFNLSSPVQTDWIEFHTQATPNRLSGGGSTIGLPTLLGSGVSWGTFAFGIGYTWTGGTPQATGTAVTEGIFVNATTATVGQGYQFTLPADTASRTVTIYWGANSCAAQLVATLSDGSATAVTHTPTATGSGNAGYYSTTLTYAANSASQTLTIACTVKTLQSGGNTWLGAAKYLASAATVTGAAASTQQSNVSTASASVGVSASAASTQASNVSAANGKVAVSGSAASTQAQNSSAASGVVIVGGVASSIQAANSGSASGLVSVSGASASTQQVNVSAALGAIKVSGSAVNTQAPNVSSASGAIGNIAQGSAASTQAANVSAATGAVSVSSSSAATQAKNASSGAASIAVRGLAASIQTGNTSAASSSAPITGASASTQAPNASTMSGAILVASTGVSVQSLNASNASGTVANPVQIMPTPLKSAYVQTSGIKMAAPVINSIAQFNFQIKQGADLTISMTWLQDDGVTPVNLTGYSMKLEIRSYTGSPTALLTLSSANNTGSYIALGGTAGTISLIFAHADTATLSPVGLPTPGSPISTGPRAYQLGVYDLQFTDPTGDIGYLLEGSVSLDPQVTV